MRSLNLGILAHVDAGKTSLTERLLYAAGVIDEIGSVDDGSTQTDSLVLERQRGITIRSAVVSFVVGDVTINLIDTPGHPDFIAEVERVLSVLDGSVLVVSAVEGVQAQTRVLMRTLQRLGIPTIIFVNKIDRGGAQHETLLRSIAEKLSPAMVAMGVPGGLGTVTADFTPYLMGEPRFAERLVEVLSEHDDALLADYVDDDTAVPGTRLRAALATQSQRASVHPVYFGSAITGAGVAALTGALTELLPTTEGATGGVVSGTVFKIERGAAGEKIAYVRMHSGVVRTRDRLQFGPDHHGKVTAIRVFANGSTEQRSEVCSGEIGRLWGLADVRVGDRIGAPDAVTDQHYFAPPTLETVVVPTRRADGGALHAALTQLAEQDPLINLRQDDVRHEVFVSLYGEVQKEVIQSTLATDFGIAVGFRETTTICIERPIGSGAAIELIAKEPNPFLATVGLHIEPAPVDTGVQFRLGIELGSLPLAFITAVEETVRETLHQGIYGWQVTDCTVTLAQSGYWPRQSHMHGTFDASMSSTAGDFRNLTPLVLMAALKLAGSAVHEPIHRFHLEAPADTLGPILSTMARLQAVPQNTTMQGLTSTLEGEIPAARVYQLQQQLPALSRGEGVLDSVFERYRPVRGAVPVRSRTDQNPLNRKDYLLRVARRISRFTLVPAACQVSAGTAGST
ncbi:MAG: GTP-binding protein [Jatrophihabitans sp.]